MLLFMKGFQKTWHRYIKPGYEFEIIYFFLQLTQHMHKSDINRLLLSSIRCC